MPLTYTDNTSLVSFTVDHISDRRYNWTISEKGVEVARSDGYNFYTCDNGLTQALTVLISDFAAYIRAVDPRVEYSYKVDLFPESCRNLAEALDAGVVAQWAADVGE